VKMNIIEILFLNQQHGSRKWRVKEKSTLPRQWEQEQWINAI
jgi:hypothetical protein